MWYQECLSSTVGEAFVPEPRRTRVAMNADKCKHDWELGDLTVGCGAATICGL
jgi:hypothetical protein